MNYKVAESIFNARQDLDKSKKIGGIGRTGKKSYESFDNLSSLRKKWYCEMIDFILENVKTITPEKLIKEFHGIESKNEFNIEKADLTINIIKMYIDDYRELADIGRYRNSSIGINYRFFL